MYTVFKGSGSERTRDVGQRAVQGDVPSAFLSTYIWARARAWCLVQDIVETVLESGDLLPTLLDSDAYCALVELDDLCAKLGIDPGDRRLAEIYLGLLRISSTREEFPQPGDAVPRGTPDLAIHALPLVQLRARESRETERYMGELDMRQVERSMDSQIKAAKGRKFAVAGRSEAEWLEAGGAECGRRDGGVPSLSALLAESLRTRDVLIARHLMPARFSLAS